MRPFSISAVVLLGFLLTEPALAVPYHVGSAHHVGRGTGLIYAPTQPVAPQFNNPGPQISLPQIGNPEEQLSPLFGAGQPDALGIK